MLCSGTIPSDYSYNLADLGSETTVKGIKQRLVEKLADTVRALEKGSDRKIAKIYIGKTFIKQRIRQEGQGYQIFNPLDPYSWNIHGISCRWGAHRNEGYGRDGLVVLGAITKETMPESCRDQVHHEDFALAMEQKLLHHYVLSHPDPRVVNRSFETRHVLQRSQYAYALYMAFRYEGESPHESEEEDSLEEGSSDLSTSDSMMEQNSDPRTSHTFSPEEPNNLPSSQETSDPPFSITTMEQDSNPGPSHTFSTEESNDLPSSQFSRGTSDPPFLTITIDSDPLPSHTPSPPSQSLPPPLKRKDSV